MGRLKKKVKHKIKKHAKDVSYLIFYRAVYIAGLATLIPLVLSLSVVKEQGYGTATSYFFASIFLIFFAFFGILKRKKSLGDTFKILGWASLIPGGIAFFLYTFGENLLYSLASFFIPGFAKLTPAVDAYLAYSLPVGILVIGYIIVGGVLYYLGSILKK